MAKKLIPRHKKFVDNLMKGMSNADAYKNAGYNPKDVFSASAAANLLLKNIKIQEALQVEEIKVRDEIERLLLDNARNAARKLGQLIDFSTPSAMVIASRDALDRVGYKPVDKQEISGTQEVNIDIKLPEGISLEDV